MAIFGSFCMSIMAPSTAIWRFLASFSARVFGEVQVERERYVEEPKFSKVVTRESIRVFLLIGAVVGLAIWLAYDVCRPLGDGIVPGIRESSFVSTGNYDEAQISSSVVSVCPCTYSSTAAPPYGRIKTADDVQLPRDVWIATQPLPSQGTLEWFYIKRYTLMMINLPATAATMTPSLLKESPWAYNRLSHIFDTSELLFTKLMDDAVQEIRNDGSITSDVEAGRKLGMIQGNLTLAKLGVMSLYGQLLNVSKVDRNIQIFGEEPSNTDWRQGRDVDIAGKFEWSEMCSSFGNSSGQPCGNNSHAAYDAYRKFCAPLLCTYVVNRSDYNKAMAGFALFGGLQSVYAIFMLAVWFVVRKSFDVAPQVHGWITHMLRASAQWIMDVWSLIFGWACNLKQIAIDCLHITKTGALSR